MRHRSSDVDTLILGQGLAGSLLALALQRLGRDCLVIDNGWRHSSSVAAAGLINPVTGQRLVKTRGLEWLLPEAHATYRGLEDELGIRIFHPRPMIRLLRNDQERSRLRQRQDDPSYQELLGPWRPPETVDPAFSAPFGAFEQFQAGFVDLPLLLERIRERLTSRGQLLPQETDIRTLRPTQSGGQCGEIRANRVVFCEGYRGKDNPWFGYLPFQPDRGEIVMLEFERPLPGHIISGGTWLIPIVRNRFRLGSTHDHTHLDVSPTTTGLHELVATLPSLLRDPPPFRVIEHRAGVRPCTRGTQPFIGTHPHHPQLHIFNGFGAKGSLLIPGYARRFADHLIGGGPLPTEADIARFPYSESRREAP